MLFDKNDNGANERAIYKAKPNLILGCKKAIYAAILLGIVLYLSPRVIQFIGDMQVYMISYVKLSLTRYTAIAFFVVILIIIIYIIWQLVGWYATDYILTNTRIIIKSGVLYTRKDYMPYSKVQDINTSQSLVAKLFNIGSVSVFSAYDNNQMRLSNISNPSQVENIIFENMVTPRGYPQPPRGMPDGNRNLYEDNGYYDEYEPITPINREIDHYPRREYEYYPEDRIYTQQNPNTPHKYEYEPYADDVGYNIDRAMDNLNSQGYEEPLRQSHEQDYYNERRNRHSYIDDDYYEDSGTELYYNDPDPESYDYRESDVVEDMDDNSETAIRRHFDKFKR